MPYSRRSSSCRYSPSPSPYKRRSVSRSLSRSLSRSPSYSRSPSPYKRGRSISRSVSRGRSRSRSSSVENPGNNLYVTGLSSRITKRVLEKHFSCEGEVVDVHLVMDPWTRESRGFGFVTMSSIKEADRCVKYLDGSVLEGRVITVEKARRRRGRTPTPGRYLGLKAGRGRHRSPSDSPHRRSHSSLSSGRGRSRSYSPYYRRRRYDSRSPSPRCRSPYRKRERSYSPYRGRHGYDEYSPYYRRDRSYTPDYIRRARGGRSYPRSDSDSEGEYYHRRNYRSSYRSRSISLRRRGSRRSYCRTPSSSPSRSPPMKGHNCRVFEKRDYSPSASYTTGASSRSVSRSMTPGSSS